MFPGHGAGKGDADRSPGWRDQYDTVNWPHSDEGFEQVSEHRKVKRYGPREATKFETVHGKVILR